ncbi:MAG: hypothetical protein KDJ14_09630 [Xanthomonadales bacterium]|nr:hypothetical protein [Xanthomonadales bacterium]
MINPVRTEWWLTQLGNLLIWARLDVGEHGTATVFDCDGRTLPYDSEDTARSALLDANFRALDGLDETDAAEMGLDLASLAPPKADSEEALRARMTQQLLRQQ